MLRVLVAGVGVGFLLVAVILARSVCETTSAICFAIYGVLFAGGIAFEKYGYRPTVDRSRGHWAPTGERFIDPVSGKRVEVQYNPETGQRDYVEVG